MQCAWNSRGVRWAVMVVAALAIVASFTPAEAWRNGRVFYPAYGGYSWEAAPWNLPPVQRPRFGYRYSVPPGAPLSYDEPGSGITYCLSQTTGFYYACGYASPAGLNVGALPPLPPDLAPATAGAAASPASGLLVFRLPQDAAAAVDGVPIGLSDGVGIHAVTPGTHRVVLSVSGKDTAYSVTVPSRKIFMVTPSAVVATEP